MKSVDLDQLLYELLIDDECKTIMVDGPWGCGKTTAVRKVVDNFNKSKNHKINQIVYKSLFGISNISELSACFTKTRSVSKAIGKTVSPVLSFVPLVGGAIVEGLNNALNSIDETEKSVKKNKIFIFDDLERTDDSFSYKSLMGLFNELILRNCKIICITSLSDLQKMNNEEDQKRINVLRWFKEKAFDRIITINESPLEILGDIFKDLNASGLSSVVSLFNDNIRIANRVKRLMRKSIDGGTKHSFNIKDVFSSDEIMKASLCTIRVIYNVEENARKKAMEELEKSNYFKYLPISQKEEMIIFRLIKDDLNDNSVNYNFLDKEKIESLCRCMANLERYNSYSEFARIFPSDVTKSESDNPLLIESFYYLNDKDKEFYFKLFKQETLCNKITIDKWYIERLFEIKKYSHFDLEEDDFLGSVINKIVDVDFSNRDNSLFNRINEYKIFSDENFDDVFITNIISRYRDLYNKKELERAKVLLQNALHNEDYHKITDFIYDVKFKKINIDIEHVIPLFVDCDFCLPDLSKSLNRQSWSFAHEMARFAFEEKIEKEFVNCLKKQVSLYPKEESLKDKCMALIKYNNFNQDYLKGFK